MRPVPVLHVGPLGFRLTGEAPPGAPELGPDYPSAGPDDAQLDLRFEAEDGPPFIPLPPPFSGARYEFEVLPDPDAPADWVRFRSYYVRGRLPLAPGPGEAIWRPAPPDHARLIVHNVVRHWSALLLPAYRLLMLHAGGCLIDGKAVLFCGVSGAGKSTATGHAATRFATLGDDIVALDFRADRPRVLTLPILNPKRPPTAAGDPHPLALICTLAKSETPTLTPIDDGATRLSRLISQAPFVNVQPELAGKALDLLAGALGELPMAELAFRRDPDFLPLLEAAVSGKLTA